ncbi:Membrane-bound lytic murein transglycosylase B precursor [Phocoenobacter uteri]|uniref:Membrane-bound lytic murein transglycosylase B n=2 Tax=Phocoenobacter uteri TaxID=146806 RepID=A0A379C9M7_9PAST|nr:Membrane-bound lytic murein transglycosylase B precursor [Phocoenobacter uteri]
MKKILVLTGVLTMILSGCSNSSENKLKTYQISYHKARTLDNFNDYVDYLKYQTQQAGISSQFLTNQNEIFYIEKAVELDERQSSKKTHSSSPAKPNPHGITRYLNRVLTSAKIDKASELWWKYQPQLNYASEKYGVPKEYLMALWGMESSFGYYQGNYDVLSVLATLAFDGRREELFKKEFISAMKILENKTIPRFKMQGSWAGAMGQSQFMPSTYLKFAADGNNDGEKNIWSEHYDIFASIANYLSSVGWDKNIPWGVEVQLNTPLNLKLSGTQQRKAKTLAQWQKLGVRMLNPKTEKITELTQTKLWLVRPNKEAGRAFLVSNNYRTLKNWNNSNYFAVSIGKFAEEIKARVY